jgi:hypothetical protein
MAFGGRLGCTFSFCDNHVSDEGWISTAWFTRLLLSLSVLVAICGGRRIPKREQKGHGSFLSFISPNDKSKPNQPTILKRVRLTTNIGKVGGHPKVPSVQRLREE